MLHSKPENFTAIRAGLSSGKVSDSVKLLSKPYLKELQKWRWKHGLYFRRRRTKVDNKTIMPGALSNGVHSLHCIKNRAKSLFVVERPRSSEAESTFRAAGGKRLSWVSLNAHFEDVQDAHAWHRLYWTLEWEGEKIVDSLVDWLDSPPNEWASHSYTVSERIRVIAELLATGDFPDWLLRKLVSQLRADAAWLYKNVETRLGVHNHLLNNARALSAAAQLLREERQSEAWLAKARSLWDELWPQIILDDGVFAEQSTHYHVLLTRTLLEYVRDARLSGRRLSADVIEKAGKMCYVTNILIRPDGTIPLFGDISPDLPTCWLRGLPNACFRAGLLLERPRDDSNGYAGGASAFFISSKSEDSVPRTRRASRSDWFSELFPKGGLLFVRHDHYDIELTAHGDPRPNSACHADTGRGSFDIWFRGRRVVVDGGVPTYDLTQGGACFRSPEGQNVIAIDRLAPSVLHYEAQGLPEWYTESFRGGAWKMRDSEAVFTWKGFERYRRGLIWERTWRWADNCIIVRDRLQGPGKVRVEGWLHFGEKGWKATATNRFENEVCVLCIDSAAGLASRLVSLPHAPDYGVVVEGQGIELIGNVQLPISWDWVFEFDVDKCAV